MPGRCHPGHQHLSLPIGDIAAATKRPEKVIGIHFMNPVPVMKGVEVIPGRHTAADVLEACKEYCKKLARSRVKPGITPVSSSPGWWMP